MKTGDTIMHHGQPCRIGAILRHPDGSITARLSPEKPKPAPRKWWQLFKK